MDKGQWVTSWTMIFVLWVSTWTFGQLSLFTEYYNVFRLTYLPCPTPHAPHLATPTELPAQLKHKIMTSPTSACPGSLLEKVGAAPANSRYFVGISPAVVFVASLSVLAFLTVAVGAGVIAAIQTFFFFVLPLASAAGGAFLVAAPEATPLGTDPTILLLLRTAGAVAIAYAGSAMLVGRSGCGKIRCAHLTLVAASLGAMSAAFVMDDSSALAGEMGDKAAVLLGRTAAAAATGALMTAAGPAFKRKLQSGKPEKPANLTCLR